MDTFVTEYSCVMTDTFYTRLFPYVQTRKWKQLNARATFTVRPAVIFNIFVCLSFMSGFSGPIWGTFPQPKGTLVLTSYCWQWTSATVTGIEPKVETMAKKGFTVKKYYVQVFAFSNIGNFTRYEQRGNVTRGGTRCQVELRIGMATRLWVCRPSLTHYN